LQSLITALKEKNMSTDISVSVNKPFGFYEQSENVKHLLKPPVGNHLIFGQKEHLKVMFVGGPNQRPDYHINEGEELFFQMKGAMDLRIIEHNKPKNIQIKEGEMFCLPPRVPHSPQRYADSCGLVIERERLPTETDALRWYVDENENVNQVEILYEKYFHCHDLGTQLKPAIMEYFASDSHTSRIPPEGTPMKSPPVDSDANINAPIPFTMQPAIEEQCPIGTTTPLLLSTCTEFTVQVVRGYNGNLNSIFPDNNVPQEFFVWAVHSNATSGTSSKLTSNNQIWDINSGESCYIIPNDTNAELVVSQQGEALLLVIFNRVYEPSPNQSSL
jgi:3-hydroxyanthranilate 3,4-dioxygenase